MSLSLVHVIRPDNVKNRGPLAKQRANIDLAYDALFLRVEDFIQECSAQKASSKGYMCLPSCAKRGREG